MSGEPHTGSGSDASHGRRGGSYTPLSRSDVDAIYHTALRITCLRVASS